MYPEEEKAGIKGRAEWMRPWMSFSDHCSCCFMSSVLFHSKYCFYVGVGEGGINFSVGNMWRRRILKGYFLLLLHVWCLVWKERISSCTSLYTHHSRVCFQVHRAVFMTRRSMSSQVAGIYMRQRKQLFFHGPGGKGTARPKCGLSRTGVIIEKVMFFRRCCRLARFSRS